MRAERALYQRLLSDVLSALSKGSISLPSAQELVSKLESGSSPVKAAAAPRRESSASEASK